MNFLIRLIIFVLALSKFLNVKIFNLWTYYKKEAKKQNHINHREAKQLFIKILNEFNFGSRQKTKTWVQTCLIMNFLTFLKRINSSKKYEDLIWLLSFIRKCDKIVFIRIKLNIYTFYHTFFLIYGLWTVSAATGGSQLSRNIFLIHLVARFRGLLSATPWLRSPASIVAPRVITLIMRLDT